MDTNKTKQKNDLPDCWLQPVNVLLVLMVSACFFVLATIFIPHIGELYRFAVAAMAAMVISTFLAVEWAIRSPSSPIFPPRFKLFNDALLKRILVTNGLLTYILVVVVVIVTVVAAVAALLPVIFFSTAPWSKPAAEVLVTRITFSNSPYIPLAPPRLRTV